MGRLNLSTAFCQFSSLEWFYHKISAKWPAAFAVQTRLISSVRKPRKTHLAVTWTGSIERRQYKIEQEFVGYLIAAFQA